jgi:hypothetical protein
LEVEPAARRRLLTVDTITGYVVDHIYKGTLDTHVEGTGGRAIVLRAEGGWSQPDPVNTQEYPLLYVDCWSDRSRNASGQATVNDARANARAVWRALDPILHARRAERWGAVGSDPGLLVVGCSRWTEPTTLDAASAHRGNWLGIPLGDCAVVTAAYALIIAHERS